MLCEVFADVERQLEYAKQKDEEDIEVEQNQVLSQLEVARKVIGALEKFHTDTSRGWKKWENCILGYVILSPLIGFNVGEEGFTENWAVIEIDDFKVDLTNFVENIIDLGITIPVDKFTAYREMWKPSPKTLDHDNNSCIMVIKRGNASDLTIRCLNTIRLITRVYLKSQPGQMSKEVIILSRNSKSGAFSRPGDSGSAVIDGKGRLAGLLTGGAGDTEVSDCTYLTSINFLFKCILEYSLKANLYPSL
ncbi:hypothetical protein EW146_g2669 [Bondarzewia mesenterica]|uniref:Peptidase S1 domain-containing protein n=1 Tax=Bondarzewia mesenterica TaxID=1095465 RepID=A0A4S4M650_9AGAM|nr:hypothetical protein EW146_g2669 [Bondarzewia mesenterica]